MTRDAGTVDDSSKATVLVYGAYGHTAHFIVNELRARRFKLVLSGRDPGKLATLTDGEGQELRVATVGDASSLDHALAGASLVINCAGPFAESAPALIEAAARAQIHYIDITAEAFVALELFERFTPRFQGAPFALIPSVGFFGALGDLAATILSDGWSQIDEVTLAVGLDSWRPTRGTRLAGERRAGRRLVLADGRLQAHAPGEPVPTNEWEFPPPFGRQEVVGELTTVDIVTMSRHLKIADVNAYLNVAPLRDLSDPTTPPPEATGPDGRSAQLFILDVVARRSEEQRRLAVHGRDIYAVTAPIVVEAVECLLTGRYRRGGVGTTAEIFDPQDFLRALATAGHVRIDGDWL
jgi:short subunit dehydrogenase-like uncharacterized protein